MLQLIRACQRMSLNCPYLSDATIVFDVITDAYHRCFNEAETKSENHRHVSEHGHRALGRIERRKNKRRSMENQRAD